MNLRDVVLNFPGSPENLRANLTWHADERLALMGPNGSGKTTVSLLMLGLIEPTAGSANVVVGGVETCVSTLLGRVAYLPQQPYFADADTVLSAVQFGAPTASEQEILEVLQALVPQSNADFLARRVTSLSAGERRLVALTRVLLREANLVVLDEPEANLDPDARQRALQAISTRCARRRMLILTHDVSFAALCDRTVRFEERLVLSGTL